MNPSDDTSRDLVAQLTRLNEQALSPRTRWWHLLLMLVALAMAILVGALLVTEPSLPSRTVTAFVTILVIALSWVVYASRVLSGRLGFLANHRVIAAGMATAWSIVFTLSALAVGLFGGHRAGLVAAGTGLVFVAAALALLVRARRNFRRLQDRRAQLESAIHGARS